ncbi:hypothetical protein [Sphingomonas sp. Ant H11]|uniref:hypothetical protein n=1 Tax=Sphingomonas sp. Ant H11 TaxID=1564113 RepID=UPI000A579901|nr:hypothetical protein [Sphingomonas sp. Ant H11]
MRRVLRWGMALLVGALASAAPAQTLSPAPDRVAVTIYRAPCVRPIRRSIAPGYKAMH